MEMTPVVSSNLAAVGYDNVQNVLHVQFKGKETIYSYQGVSLDLFNEMMSAPSIGSFYAKRIKNQFQSEVVPYES